MGIADGVKVLQSLSPENLVEKFSNFVPSLKAFQQGDVCTTNCKKLSKCTFLMTNLLLHMYYRSTEKCKQFYLLLDNISKYCCVSICGVQFLSS